MTLSLNHRFLKPLDPSSMKSLRTHADDLYADGGTDLAMSLHAACARSLEHEACPNILHELRTQVARGPEADRYRKERDDARRDFAGQVAINQTIANALAQAKDDIVLLQSWHYNRTDHEERGCRCVGTCVLADRAAKAIEILVRR